MTRAVPAEYRPQEVRGLKMIVEYGNDLRGSILSNEYHVTCMVFELQHSMEDCVVASQGIMAVSIERSVGLSRRLGVVGSGWGLDAESYLYGYMSSADKVLTWLLQRLRRVQAPGLLSRLQESTREIIKVLDQRCKVAMMAESTLCRLVFAWCYEKTFVQINMVRDV